MIKKYRLWRRRGCERRGHHLFAAQLIHIPTYCLRCDAPNIHAEALEARFAQDLDNGTTKLLKDLGLE